MEDFFIDSNGDFEIRIVDGFLLDGNLSIIKVNITFKGEFEAR